MLIELLGLTGALLVGAACSATAGVVALLLRDRARSGRARRRAGGTAAGPERAASREANRDPDRRRLALSLAFVSGLTSLGYQVVWNRLLGAGTGSSTYVFTIILVLFLVGIATGAVLLGVIRPRVARSSA